jgi:hypothetical protein
VSAVLLLCRFAGCEIETERGKLVGFGGKCLGDGTTASPSSSISANEPKSSTWMKGVCDECALDSSSSSSLMLMKLFRRLDRGMRLAARDRPSRHARASMRLFRL